MLRKLISTVLILTCVAVSFTACKDKKEPEASLPVTFSEGPLITTTETPISESIETSVSVSTETSVSEDVSGKVETPGTEAETVEFGVMIVNQCNADIALVCTIDPYTDEQVDVGPLPNAKAINLSFSEWPKAVTVFDVAFYNNNGNLVATTQVDLTGVKEKVTIILAGDGTIEDFEEVVD